MTEKARVFCSQCKFFENGYDKFESDYWCQPDNAPAHYTYYDEYIKTFSPREQNRNNDCPYFQRKEKNSGGWLKGIFSFG